MSVIVPFFLIAFLTVSSAQKFPNFSAEGCASLPVLVCNVQATGGFKTNGTVYFAPAWRKDSPDSDQYTCFTRVTASIDGLSGPSHGIHIHTYGDLSFTDGTSTGGHFSDPSGKEIPHGMPTDEDRHWGDLGNVEVNSATGIAEYDRIDKVIRLGGVLGRSITIHESADQGSAEQPSGAAGARVGFCVIGYSNPDILAGR